MLKAWKGWNKENASGHLLLHSLKYRTGSIIAYFEKAGADSLIKLTIEGGQMEE